MNTNTRDNSCAPTILETERLILRAPRLEDALGLSELAENDRVFAQSTVGGEANSIEGACTAIVRMLAEKREGQGSWWVVIEKASGRIAGLTGYSARTATSGIVTALSSHYAGRGFANEIINAFTMLKTPLATAHRPSLDAENAHRVNHHAPAQWYWQSKRGGLRSNSLRICA